MSRARTVFEARSSFGGRVRVLENARERLLLAGGEILSILPLRDDWRALRREYWWHALVAVAIPPRPRALLVGLGGGTQVHLLHALARPRAITVIERDPVILQVAHDWFGLDRVGGLEFLCADAEAALPALAAARRRFDFVMEDAVYAVDPARSFPLALALVDLVAPGGTLVLNRHRRGDAREVARALRPSFAEVKVRRVRREGENVLVCCAGRRARSHRP